MQNRPCLPIVFPETYLYDHEIYLNSSFKFHTPVGNVLLAMPAWPGFAVYRTSFFNRQSRLTHKEHTGTSGANLEHKPPAGTSYAGQVKPIRKYLEGNQCTLHFITSCRLVHTLNLLVKFAAKHIAGLYMLYTEQLNSFLSIFFFFFFFFLRLSQ